MSAFGFLLFCLLLLQVFYRLWKWKCFYCIFTKSRTFACYYFIAYHCLLLFALTMVTSLMSFSRKMRVGQNAPLHIHREAFIPIATFLQWLWVKHVQFLHFFLLLFLIFLLNFPLFYHSFCTTLYLYNFFICTMLDCIHCIHLKAAFKKHKHTSHIRTRHHSVKWER